MPETAQGWCYPPVYIMIEIERCHARSSKGFEVGNPLVRVYARPYDLRISRVVSESRSYRIKRNFIALDDLAKIAPAGLNIADNRPNRDVIRLNDHIVWRWAVGMILQPGSH